jgi:hypothetical protein
MKSTTISKAEKKEIELAKKNQKENAKYELPLFMSYHFDGRMCDAFVIPTLSQIREMKKNNKPFLFKLLCWDYCNDSKNAKWIDSETGKKVKEGTELSKKCRSIGISGEHESYISPELFNLIKTKCNLPKKITKGRVLDILWAFFEIHFNDSDEEALAYNILAEYKIAA